MATVRDILARKNTQLWSVAPDATVLDAALLMNEHKIGALLVLEQDRLTGIITERDILQRVVAGRREPGGTRVGEVMTSELMCCQLHTGIEEARVVMKDARIRHLPVIDEDEQLCGVISIGDLNAFDAQSKEMTIHLLEQYISGHPGGVAVAP